MHQRNHERDQARRAAEVSDDVASPGRTSASAQLASPERPAASGIVMRRGADGVAAGAETAVATAASSSGTPLPATLMRKFESSLGADLSTVRVHTGAESAAAAHAVGARAYALGQDIHFGAGHYDPGSSAGEHLLAHEVAHTVQQGGGAPMRQHKLEVSSPGDALEHEADRAADAMTSGAQFAVATGGGGLSRSTQRIARDPITLDEVTIVGDPNVIELDEVEIGPEKPNVIELDEVEIGPEKVIELDEVEITAVDTGPASTDKMAKQADEAEQKAQARAKSAGNTVIGDAGVLTLENKQQADSIVKLIQHDASKLDQGVAAGDVQPFVRLKNQEAIATLSTYAETLESDKFNTDSFQQQAQVMSADFARLHAQMMTLDKSGQGSGQISEVAKTTPAGASRGTKLGETVLEAGSGQSAATLNKDFNQTITAADGAPGHSTNATAHWKNAQDREKEMRDAEQKVSEGGRDIMPKQAAAQAAASNIKAMAAAEAVGAHQSEIDKLKADAAAAEEKVRLVGGTIKNAAAVGFAVADPKGPNIGAAVGAALDIITNLVAYSAKHFSDGDIEKEEDKKKVAKANEIFERTNGAAKNAQKAVQELKNTATSYYENLGRLATAKTKYREAMKLMGNAMDKVQGGNAFSITAQVLSEAETYLVQSKLAIELGRNAVGELPKELGGPRQDPGTQGSVTYYLAVQPPDKHTYFATRGSITMKGSLTSKDHILAKDLNAAIEKMEQERAEIEALAKSLRAVFKV